MKKQPYIELSREESLQRTYQICLKWASDKDQMKGLWANRPLFEQHEIQETTDAVDSVGWEEIPQEDEKVFSL